MVVAMTRAERIDRLCRARKFIAEAREELLDLADIHDDIFGPPLRECEDALKAVDELRLAEMAEDMAA